MANASNHALPLSASRFLSLVSQPSPLFALHALSLLLFCLLPLFLFSSQVSPFPPDVVFCSLAACNCGKLNNPPGSRVGVERLTGEIKRVKTDRVKREGGGGAAQ